MKIIILAAGMGTRLNHNKPKCLTKLHTGETILDRQLNSLLDFVDKKDITIVVGYKSELIKKQYENYSFVVNPYYKDTNTAKSLLYALDKNNADSGIIWLNGDVVFDSTILKPLFGINQSSMLVNKSVVGDEEVKYNLNDDGSIKQVSKVIKNGLGEAVGINKILNMHIDKFISNLKKCSDGDYFENAIELLINENVKIYPIDILKSFCYEIDTQYDLNFVNKYLKENENKSKN